MSQSKTVENSKKEDNPLNLENRIEHIVSEEQEDRILTKFPRNRIRLENNPYKKLIENDYFEIDEEKKDSMFVGANITAAFKSRDEGVIAEYGLGLVIIESGVVRERVVSRECNLFFLKF